MTTQREPTTYAPPSGVATWVTTNRDRRAFLLCCVSVGTSVHTRLTIVRLLASNPRPSSPGDTACGLSWCGWVRDGDGGVRPRVMITLHIFGDPLTTPSFPSPVTSPFVEALLCGSLSTAGGEFIVPQHTTATRTTVGCCKGSSPSRYRPRLSVPPFWSGVDG